MRKFFLIIFIFFSFINTAKSIDYTVLTNNETEYLLEEFLQTNDFWYGIYINDEETDEIKIGYTNIWYEKKDRYLDYNEPLIIINSESKFNINTEGNNNAIDIITKQIFQASPPYNLLYDFEIESGSEGSYFKITSTRENDIMNVIFTDGIKEENKVFENFDFRLNHYLTEIAFLLPGQDFIGNSIKSKDFSGGKFSDITFTFSEKRKEIVQGVPYEYHVYEVLSDDEEFPSSGEMLIDPVTNIPIFHSWNEIQMEMRLEDREIAKDLNNQQDLFIKHNIPLDRDYFEIILENQDSEIKNIFLEIQGNYKDQFPTAFQQEVIEVDNTKYLVLASFFNGSLYGTVEEASNEDVQINLQKKDFDPIDDPEIIALAKKGINGATGVKDQIDNLAAFVSDYVEDELINGSWSTVYEIIKNKSGDCTEHSVLFNVLARSIGIPSREISGYAYDYKTKTFIGHAWNEVVIDGYWYPIDPTWNVFGFLGHIKESEDTIVFSNNLEFRLALMEFANGEEIIF